MSAARVSPWFVPVAVCALTAVADAGQLRRPVPGTGHVISGRVVDPHGVRPDGTTLLLWRHETRPDGFSSSGDPIPLTPDGSFVTPPVTPGVYVLELHRGMFTSGASSVIGVTLVTVGHADVAGAIIEVRRETALIGRFRMESDDPAAEWPASVAVLTYFAVDDVPMMPTHGSEGREGGAFVLRNAFGPRVLRPNILLASPSRWWPSKVLLDGRDVTNVPTDFSEHPDASLEVVFTQHPARIVGTVTDAQGQPVALPWVLVSGTDPTSTQTWATTSTAVRGGTRGGFEAVVTPGEYRVHALPADAFPGIVAARIGMARVVHGGVPVTVGDRETARVAVQLQAR